MKKLDWSKDGFYDPNVGSFMMQFGIGTIKTDGKIGAYKGKSSPQL